MKVLVTGASGFLGQYVLRSFSQLSVPVLAWGRKAPSGPQANAFEYLDLLEEPRVEFLVDRVKEAGATHLLHLAWSVEPGKYWNSPLNFRWTDLTVRLVEAFCQAGGQGVVCAGTSAEYDWDWGLCREEGTPLEPKTIYGIAKDAARRQVFGLCQQFGVPAAWGRIFIPYGRGENVNRLVPSLIRFFLGKGDPFSANLEAYRDFIFASDVADALTCLLLSSASGCYNISSGVPTKISDLVTAIAQSSEADPARIREIGAQPRNEPPFIIGENLRLRSLGWSPKVSLSEGLLRTIREVS